MSKRMLILGSGESGTGAALLAASKGMDVLVSDAGTIKANFKAELSKAGVRTEEGSHVEALQFGAEEAVKSPGISSETNTVAQLKSKGVRIISEIELAGRYTDATMVCITGSNGKTTTTLLTHHILKSAGIDAGLAGNVGRSLARSVAQETKQCYVVELSSFQLEDMYDFKADIAILTNITPDHLDRYDYDFDKYASSKFRIIRNQRPTDHFIFNAGDPQITSRLATENPMAIKQAFALDRSLAEAQGHPAAFIEETHLIINIQEPLTMSIQELALQGKHNLLNSMAAGVAARVLDLRKEIVRESLTNFENVEHRLEPVAKVNGIQFINDSKATNVNSTWYALESQSAPVIWVAGGVDKGNDYSELFPLISGRVKALICLGTDNEKLKNAFGDKVATIVEVSSASEAVRIAYDLGLEGDVVLLSPACASFDLFKDFEDRGRQFKAAVKAL